ncbi:MAG: hypothetical protein BYD32DRAFT_491676 [Podila humilis]|nr:MAG: hypothetical protein BYD32DRAFT_491676 [Podila humilis]
MSTSALDIPLVVNAICHHLSLPDICTCQQVCRSWSTLFKPHIWRVTRLPSTTSFSQNDLNTLLRNKSWIQSLKVSAVHLHKSSRAHSHSLRELVLYDDTHSLVSYEETTVCVDRVVVLIEKSVNLTSLEIDLNSYHYRSKRLAPALLLTIAKHPSLINLTWALPNQVWSYAFGRALLYVCHHRSMQELYLKRRPTTSDHEYYTDWWPNWDSFYTFRCPSLDPLQDDSLEYIALRARLNADTPLDQLGGPFAFKRLFLDFDESRTSSSTLMDMIRLCPNLEHVRVEAYHMLTLEDMVDLLVDSCPALRRLDFSEGCPSPQAYNLRLFSKLQQIRFGNCMREDDFSGIFYGMQPHRESLEAIAINIQYISVTDAIQVIKTFPRLRVLDLGCLKIFVHDHGPEHSRQGCLQSRAQLQSLEIVVKEWHSSCTETMQYTEMDFWWDAWGKAQRFMDSFIRLYVQWSGQPPLRPVHVRFMYPLRYFLRVEEAMQYCNIVEEGPENRRPMTIEDVRRLGLYARNSYSQFTLDELMNRCTGSSWWEEEETLDYDEEYDLSKSRNRHHTLRDKKRSIFRRPFKK